MCCFSCWYALLSRRFAWCHACIEDMRGSIYLGTLAVGTLLTVKKKMFNSMSNCVEIFFISTCQGKRTLVPNTMALIISACFMENSNPVIFILLSRACYFRKQSIFCSILWQITSKNLTILWNKKLYLSITYNIFTNFC